MDNIFPCNILYKLYKYANDNSLNFIWMRILWVELCKLRFSCTGSFITYILVLGFGCTCTGWLHILLFDHIPSGLVVLLAGLMTDVRSSGWNKLSCCSFSGFCDKVAEKSSFCSCNKLWCHTHSHTKPYPSHAKPPIVTSNGLNLISHTKPACL